jgi:Fic family protein
MDAKVIAQSPIGSLIPISGTDGRTGDHYDSHAYLADVLPSSVELSNRTWAVVVEAESMLARLDQAAGQVPDPGLLRRPTLQREAQSTSALEGTFAPLEAVMESDDADWHELPSDLREIVNYVIAAEEAFEWIGERPITAGLIGSLQGVLVEGTSGQYSDAGGIRDRHVFIGPEDAPIEEARFVPAPFGDQLSRGFEAWVAWVDDPPEHMPAVVQAALAHYQFETLHPFSDGNGRIGRLLIVLQLMQLRILREPILVVSPWFETRRDQYQDELLRLTLTGDWDTWVRFFATGVRAAAQTTTQKIAALLAWQEHALEVVRTAGISGVAERVAGELIGGPVLRASTVKRRHDVSHQGAMNALRRLKEVGLVEERFSHGQITFTAQAVLALLRA